MWRREGRDGLSVVQAIKVGSGDALWKYDPELLKTANVRKLMPSWGIHGVGIGREKVIVGLQDGRLIGLDTKFGKLVRSTRTLDEKADRYGGLQKSPAPHKIESSTRGCRPFEDNIQIISEGTSRNVTCLSQHLMGAALNGRHEQRGLGDELINQLPAGERKSPSIQDKVCGILLPHRYVNSCKLLINR